MKRGEISIPAPIANQNDKVMVLNYRNNKWEEGIVKHLRYQNMWGKYSWSYDIETFRRAKSGHPVKLYVGDEDIKKCLNLSGKG